MAGDLDILLHGATFQNQGDASFMQVQVGIDGDTTDCGQLVCDGQGYFSAWADYDGCAQSRYRLAPYPADTRTQRVHKHTPPTRQRVHKHLLALQHSTRRPHTHPFT